MQPHRKKNNINLPDAPELLRTKPPTSPDKAVEAQPHASRQSDEIVLVSLRCG